MLVFIHKKTFFEKVLTGKSLKQCMFKITLQISIYAQNILRKKEDFDIKSVFIYYNIFFK